MTGIFLSGCVSKSADNPKEEKSPASTSSPITTQASQSVEQNKINELENKINSMQQQINELQAKIDILGLPKPSNKSLIPRVPFRIEVREAEMQVPTVWTFKENGELEIRYTTWTDSATYKLYPDNNTIKVSSAKSDYYGLVLYDDYATGIYENGWIAWAKKYQIFPPKYNAITQKYELN